MTSTICNRTVILCPLELETNCYLALVFDAEPSSKGLTFFHCTWLAAGSSHVLCVVWKSLLYSTDGPSPPPDEDPEEREDHSGTSHGLDDCPNTNQALADEGENQELLSESYPEGLTGASDLATGKKLMILQPHHVFWYPHRTYLL